MDTVARKARAILLDDQDLIRLCGKSCRVIPFEDLRGYDDIDEVFAESNGVILYWAVSGPNRGHYTCMVRRSAGSGSVVEFFDSYGQTPEEVFKNAQYEYARAGGRDYLAELVGKTGQKYHFTFRYNNTRRLQQEGGNVNTCGRYCALRVRFQTLSNEQFADLLAGQRLSPDDLVSMMTMLFTERQEELDKFAREALR